MNIELFKRVLSSLILGPLAIFLIISGSFLFVFFLLICFFITFYEWHLMSKKKSYNIYGIIFMIFSFYSVYKLRFSFDESYVYLLFTTIICISTDIGGYIFGKIFKGPKLTKYSPKKTYSGVFGSYLLSLICSAIFMNYFFINDLYIPWLLFIFFVSTISQLGDLTISYFKRQASIKDTGNILPGHGGLLDRIDGMIFAFPFSYMILSINFF